MKTLGIPVKVETLNSGDIAFTGRGEGGKPISIGVEHKKLNDYLASMKGRMQGRQLTEMLKDYDRRYVIIEGEFEHDGQGRLLRRAGRAFWKPIPGAPPAAEVLKMLLVMELRGGVYTITTTKQRQSCLWLMSLYRVWTDKDMDDHRSHLALYAPDLDTTLTEEVSVFRRMVGQLPGVGFKRSKAFEDAFDGDMDKLMAASLRELADVETEGRKFGKSAAQRAYKELHP